MTGTNLEIATRLAALTPTEIDSRAVSSVQQCVSSLTKTTETKGGAILKDGTTTPVTYHQRLSIRVSTSSELASARAKLAACMTPPDKRQVVGWLAELSVITARRQDDEQTEHLRTAAYAQRLEAYPADIARHALLGHRWKFFPTWADLEEVCEAAVSKRRQLSSALDKAETDMLARNAKAQAQDDCEDESPRQPREPESAQQIMDAAGLTQERIKLLRRFPMARTFDEAEKMMEPEQDRGKHWSDGLPDDHPEMIALRKARAASMVIPPLKPIS